MADPETVYLLTIDGNLGDTGPLYNEHGPGMRDRARRSLEAEGVATTRLRERPELAVAAF